MLSTPRTSAISTNRIRRRRVTTACVSCRDRRVKCDRIRPACSQCKGGTRKCTYVDKETKAPFVDETRDLASESDRNDLSSDTWKSAINQQAENVNVPGGAKDGVPLWAVAEAHEPPIPSNLPALKAYAIPISSLGDDFIASITAKLPPWEVCEPYFESFLHGVHPIIPVCHIPTLRQEYSEFWSNLNPNVSAKFLALVLAVLYTGAASCKPFDRTHSQPIRELYEELFALEDFSTYHIRNTAASIHMLQAYVIMNSFKASHFAPFFAYGFLPQAIRFAQSLRLHVDQKKGSLIDIEVKRRIWWHLVFLDVESTIATGLPPIIHRAGYTTQLPSLLNDDALPSSGEVIPQPIHFSPIMIAMQGHYQWASRMQAWFETLPTQAAVTSFKDLIEILLALIPTTSEPENTWARLYLKMQIDRAYCMLGLRFWQPDQYKGTGCHSEVVKTARSFLTHYTTLSTLPSHPHFSWFVPGVVQPLHALIILLMHISTCSCIIEEEALSRNLIDNILCMRVNHILNGEVLPPKMRVGNDPTPQRANPRHLIMINLRKRVWKKVGWEGDEKGVDPWGGRHTDEEENTCLGTEKERAMELNETPQEVSQQMASSQLPEGINGGWDGDDGTGLEELDNLLAGDPLDMFQWDEWESLTSEFFAS